VGPVPTGEQSACRVLGMNADIPEILEIGVLLRAVLDALLKTVRPVAKRFLPTQLLSRSGPIVPTPQEAVKRVVTRKQTRHHISPSLSLGRSAQSVVRHKQREIATSFYIVVVPDAICNIMCRFCTLLSSIS
jgi:hypothetical protein